MIKPKTKSPPKKPARRNYHPAEVIAGVLAVRTNNGDIAKTARELKIPDQTLRQWVNGERKPYLLSLSDAKKGDMAGVFRDAVWQFLGLAMGKADKAPFNHLMTGAGIAFDKMRILSGQAAMDNGSVNLHVHTQARELVDKMDNEQFRQLVAVLDSAGCNTPSGPGAGEPGTLSPVPRGQLPDAREESDDTL